MLKIFSIFITSLIFLSSAHAETVKVFDFTEKELSALEIRKVRGADNKTSYSVGSNENGNYLKAVADNAASGLGCLLYTSPSPRDPKTSRMPSSA